MELLRVFLVRKVFAGIFLIDSIARQIVIGFGLHLVDEDAVLLIAITVFLVELFGSLLDTFITEFLQHGRVVDDTSPILVTTSHQFHIHLIKRTWPKIFCLVDESAQGLRADFGSIGGNALHQVALFFCRVGGNQFITYHCHIFARILVLESLVPTVMIPLQRLNQRFNSCIHHRVSCLFVDSLKDGLTNPPDGIRQEFALCIDVKLFCRFLETFCSNLNQFFKREPLVFVLVGHTDHEPQVRLYQLFHLVAFRPLFLNGLD